MEDRQYTFDPKAIRIKDAREYRLLNGSTVWESMGVVQEKGPLAITEDEVVGLAYLIRKQNEEDPDAFSLKDMESWTLGDCLDLVQKLQEALLDRPQKGSETSS
jgi:hypothetical protein